MRVRLSIRAFRVGTHSGVLKVPLRPDIPKNIQHIGPAQTCPGDKPHAPLEVAGGLISAFMLVTRPTPRPSWPGGRVVFAPEIAGECSGDSTISRRMSSELMRTEAWRSPGGVSSRRECTCRSSKATSLVACFSITSTPTRSTRRTPRHPPSGPPRAGSPLESALPSPQRALPPRSAERCEATLHDSLRQVSKEGQLSAVNKRQLGRIPSNLEGEGRQVRLAWALENLTSKSVVVRINVPEDRS